MSVGSVVRISLCMFLLIELLQYLHDVNDDWIWQIYLVFVQSLFVKHCVCLQLHICLCTLFPIQSPVQTMQPLPLLMYSSSDHRQPTPILWPHNYTKESSIQMWLIWCSFTSSPLNFKVKGIHSQINFKIIQISYFGTDLRSQRNPDLH